MGTRLECTLLSTDPGSYCRGVARGSGPTEEMQLKKVVDMLKEGSIWKFSKITLAKEKVVYVSAPVKHVIDLLKSHKMPVLQSMASAFPKCLAPRSDLATVMKLRGMQKIDVTTLIQSVSSPREVTTRFGQRVVADFVLMDDSSMKASGGSEHGSGATGASEHGCRATVPIFFAATDTGRQELTKLQGLMEQGEPVSFLAVTCSREVGDMVRFASGQGFHWEHCVVGERAQRLKANAAQLRGKGDDELQDLTAKSAWQPQEARDFAEEEATITTARLLASVLQESVDSQETVFQLNHVRLVKPGPGDQIRTNDGARLFVPARVLDYSGSVVLRMREKAALGVSGELSADVFQVSCEEGHLSYPTLCSIRVLVRPARDGAAEHAAQSQAAGDDAAEHVAPVQKSAVIVEAVAQPWVPPTAAIMRLHSLLEILPGTAEKMMVARLGDIERSPHAGLLVHGGTISCECALALVAARERSKGNKFGTGFRVLTKNVVDCDPWLTVEEGGSTFGGQLASICSVDNVTPFTLNPPRPGQMQYALVVVSNVTPCGGEVAGVTLTVDHVEQVGADAVEDVLKMLRKLGALGRMAPQAELGTQITPRWSSQTQTPWTQRKTRRLDATPTDGSIPDATSAAEHGGSS